MPDAATSDTATPSPENGRPPLAWTIDRAHYPKASGTYHLTEHATERMDARRIDPAAVRRALTYGRVIYARGAAHFFLGHKEAGRYDAVPASDNGLHVVVSSIDDRHVMTVYRNPDEVPRP